MRDCVPPVYILYLLCIRPNHFTDFAVLKLHLPMSGPHYGHISLLTVILRKKEF